MHRQDVQDGQKDVTRVMVALPVAVHSRCGDDGSDHDRACM